MSAFEAELEEQQNGHWRALGVSRFLRKSRLQEELLQPNTFPDEDSARAWLNKIGRSRGFKACKVTVIPRRGEPFVMLCDF